MITIWCTVHEIWSVTRTIFCHFGPFSALLPPLRTKKIKIFKKWKKKPWRYYHFTNMYHKCPSYDVWFLRYEAWQTEFLVILDHFLHFYPPKNLKNQNFEKLKKAPGNIIILHKCTKNYNYMLYWSWDMACDRCNCYFSFSAIFCPFTPLTVQKMKISKKCKKSLVISSIYTNVPKMTIIWCMVPEIWSMTDWIFCHFGSFFALLPF